MSSWYAGTLTRLAFLWRIERADGVAVGFTSHDRDLWRDGFRYRAAPGMKPSAIERTTGLDTDELELSGALASAVFTESDLLSGRWDGAQLIVSAVDWGDAGAAQIVLARGSFGAVEVSDGGFTVRPRGQAALFDRPILETTSPSCRAELGDKMCGIDLAGRRHKVRVVKAEASRLTVDRTLDGLAGGRWRWLDGRNAGLAARIAAQAGDQVELEDTPPLPVAAGDRAEVTQGCDKRFATCVERFGNGENFRGEPHLPGNDLLLRYGD